MRSTFAKELPQCAMLEHDEHELYGAKVGPRRSKVGTAGKAREMSEVPPFACVFFFDLQTNIWGQSLWGENEIGKGRQKEAVRQ